LFNRIQSATKAAKRVASEISDDSHVQQTDGGFFINGDFVPLGDYSLGISTADKGVPAFRKKATESVKVSGEKFLVNKSELPLEEVDIPTDCAFGSKEKNALYKLYRIYSRGSLDIRIPEERRLLGAFLDTTYNRAHFNNYLPYPGAIANDLNTYEERKNAGYVCHPAIGCGIDISAWRWRPWTDDNGVKTGLYVCSRCALSRKNKLKREGVTLENTGRTDNKKKKSKRSKKQRRGEADEEERVVAQGVAEGLPSVEQISQLWTENYLPDNHTGTVPDPRNTSFYLGDDEDPLDAINTLAVQAAAASKKRQEEAALASWFDIPTSIVPDGFFVAPATPTATTIPLAEPTTVPTVVTIPLPPTEPAVEPTPLPPTEPVVAPTIVPPSEPAAEPTPQPPAEHGAEYTTLYPDEAAPLPPAEPTPPPPTEPAAEPTPQPPTEPAAEPTPQPPTEPTVEPTPLPPTEPAVEPTPLPPTEPVVAPTTVPPSEPAAESPKDDSFFTSNEASKPKQPKKRGKRLTEAEKLLKLSTAIKF
jgi:hypothetical protein